MASAAPMTLSPPFAWDGDHIWVDLGEGARGLFTTRRGGTSEGPYASLNLGRFTEDDPATIERNWEVVHGLVGRDRSLLWAKQVHGTVVTRGEHVAEADGHATADPHAATIVFTADCLPILLAAEGAVAAVHAGWRGLAGGVLEEGVAALRDVGGAGAIRAAIGPAACGRCYEVGDEVREAFGHEPLGRPAPADSPLANAPAVSASGGRPIDLKAIARERLEALGVRVDDVGLCTMCSPGIFFSHRADGGVTGRQAGVAWLT
jgi:polyphenol oxidase